MRLGLELSVQVGGGVRYHWNIELELLVQLEGRKEERRRKGEEGRTGREEKSNLRAPTDGTGKTYVYMKTSEHMTHPRQSTESAAMQKCSLMS